MSLYEEYTLPATAGTPPPPSSAPHKVSVAMRMILNNPKYTLVNWASDDKMV